MSQPGPSTSIARGLLFLFFSAVVVGFYQLGGTELFSLQGIEQQHRLWQSWQQQYALSFLIGFFILYLLITAFSLPAASLMTLIAGSLFGFWQGLLLVSFASSLGATLAFLMARFILGEKLKQRFSQQLPRFHQGFKEEGAFYLFALRLVPLFPFFMVNLLMGLLPIKTWTFYWVSQLGMLAGTCVYVYAGTELGKIRQLSDISSPGLIAAFVLLGLFPLISKKLMHYFRAKMEQAHD